jgi:hypothetical protein
MNIKKQFSTGKRFIKSTLPLMITIVSFSLLSAGLFAQANFSGSWAFNESKSALGEGPMMSATSMTVTQTADLISMDLVQPSFDGSGDMKRSEKYTLDGKESVNVGMMNSSVKAITTWSADKKELKFDKTTTFDMNGEKMEMKSTENWKISDDGKALSIKSVLSSPMGEMNVTLVYDKK